MSLTYVDDVLLEEADGEGVIEIFEGGTIVKSEEVKYFEVQDWRT